MFLADDVGAVMPDGMLLELCGLGVLPIFFFDNA